MEKSNQSIARKCISFIPRLQRRPFKLVFTATGACRILDINSCPAEMLTPFFNKVQQFMVDYDIQGDVAMGRENDLFLTLDMFQFIGGFHAHTVSAVDMLDGFIAEFSHAVVVKSPLGEEPIEYFRKPEPIDNTRFMMHCIRMVGVQFKKIEEEGGQLFQLRRFVPGPPGTHERNWFYTVGAFDMNTDLTTPLADRTDKDDLVVVSVHNPRLRKGVSSGPYATTAVTVTDFLKLVRLLNISRSDEQFNADVPDMSGNFWLRRTTDV